MKQFDYRSVIFYSLVSLIIGYFIVSTFKDDVESFIDRTSLSWLQNRGIDMTEEELAESKSQP